MDRPSEDDVLLRVAEVWATRSTCSRSAVGAVVALRGRTLTSGYNGSPAGMPHCDHTCDCKSWIDDVHALTCRSLEPCRTAVHAEANAIAFAARHGVALAGGTLYTTVTPCLPCAQLVVNAGIVRVVAAAPYRDNAGKELLQAAGLLPNPLDPLNLVRG